MFSEGRVTEWQSGRNKTIEMKTVRPVLWYVLEEADKHKLYRNENNHESGVKPVVKWEGQYEVACQWEGQECCVKSLGDQIANIQG